VADAIVAQLDVNAAPFEHVVEFRASQSSGLIRTLRQLTLKTLLPGRQHSVQLHHECREFIGIPLVYDLGAQFRNQSSLIPVHDNSFYFLSGFPAIP
jgi:hypothetical protein